MHDIICGMALWLAHDFGKEKDKWVVRSGAGVNQVLHEKDRWCRVERATLFLTTEELVNQSIPCEANELQFLCIYTYFDTGVGIVVENLRFFSDLACLDLFGCHLGSFPDYISNLVNLRYLNLSSNSITFVPEELKHVRNLRYLFLQNNKNISFPKGVISELKELVILDLYKSGGVYLTWLIEEIKCLENLRCLNITLKHPTHFKNLLDLPYLPVRCLQWNYVNETDTLVIPSSFIGNSRVQDNLYKLEVAVRSVSKIVIESNSQSQLRYLEFLSFENMGMLEMIEWRNLAPEDLLPALDSDNIVQLVERFGVASATEPTFPSLIKLSLCRLPKMQIICDQSVMFPSLEEIKIVDCPMLKKLPFQSNTVPSKLKIISIKKECWEQLEWEDHGLKQILQPLVEFW